MTTNKWLEKARAKKAKPKKKLEEKLEAKPEEKLKTERYYVNGEKVSKEEYLKATEAFDKMLKDFFVV